MRNALLPALLGLAALLGVLVLVELKDAGSAPATETAAPHTAAVAAGGPGFMPAADHLAAAAEAILARPLFEPSRRPPTIATAGTSATAAGLPRLAGIIITSGRRSVIFANPATGRPLVLAEGEKVDGYLIQSISPDQVVVVDRDGSHLLRPTFDHAAAAGAPTAAPSALASPLPLAAPTTLAGSFGRVALPGLSGRPIGLAAVPSSEKPSTFPSIAAPADSGVAR